MRKTRFIKPTISLLFNRRQKTVILCHWESILATGVCDQVSNNRQRQLSVTKYCIKLQGSETSLSRLYRTELQGKTPDFQAAEEVAQT
jgi:hypothetical protein